MRANSIHRVAAVGLVASTLLIASFAVGAGPAFAHDELIGSNPKDGSSITVAPERVTLYFEEPPAAGPTALAIAGPAGDSVVAGPPVISGSTVYAPLDAVTKPGRYTITFGIMSDDGHPVSGTLGFTLTAPANAAAAITKPGAPAKKDASSSTPLWIAGAALLVVVAAGVITVSRRRSRTKAMAS
ncbi:MAG TPA: copper resistance CopC family protein [Jatrophihabitantaceae bacterium]|jgi:hypothetical protein